MYREELLTEDILKIFKEKYKNGEFRMIGNNVQQSKTVEIQNAHFLVNKPWIVREPNMKYYEKEKMWYLSQSRNVYDILGKTPDQWIACSDRCGNINSNYGWCIFSEENHSQFKSCRNKLIGDPHTREAVMIYTRPSMQKDYKTNGMHDFMCTQYVQYFLNERDNEVFLDSIVNIRSNDAVYGFNNDSLWFSDVQSWLTDDLNAHEDMKEFIEKNGKIKTGKLWWNAGSIHIYERHFNLLEN